MLLAAENLVIRRLGRVVLDGVCLSVETGECVSIIGPNGAGKSTLMAALVGLLAPATGLVRLNDRPIASIPRRQVARQMGYVPQIHEGYLGFSVRDIVEAGRYPHLDPLQPLGEADHRAVAEAVAATGIEPFLGRAVDTLSGGERQKAWLAAALAQQTPVLLLDEPTSALDPAHQVELIRIMRAYAAAGNTLLVVCHDLNVPLALGGRVIAMRSGRIAFDEAVGALEDERRLHELYGAEFSVCRDTDARTFVNVRV